MAIRLLAQLIIHAIAEGNPQMTFNSASEDLEEPFANGKGGIATAPSGTDGDADDPVQAVRRLLETHRGDRQLVLMQDFPDPDALSAAWAYKLIAANYKIECDIVYAGTLSHQENIALVRLTGLPARRWIAAVDNPNLPNYQGLVLVDNQGTTSQLYKHLRAAGLPLVLVIDHHAPQSKLDAEFIDLRPHIRATATILTQYLQQGLLTLDRNNSKHTKCATALMHGLRADTNQLMHAGIAA
jgi:nanoRNase/pAp phosphatase (c-di-AMP/oligoRNAs hydrolase)